MIDKITQENEIHIETLKKEKEAAKILEDKYADKGKIEKAEKIIRGNLSINELFSMK